MFHVPVMIFYKHNKHSEGKLKQINGVKNVVLKQFVVL